MTLRKFLVVAAVCALLTVSMGQMPPSPLALTPWQPLAISGPAGVYTLTLPAGALITQTASGITITWGTPGPGPTPDPTPTPTPAPVLNGPYTVLFVIDQKSLVPITGAQAAMMDSKTILGVLKAMAFGNQWAAVDITAPTIASWLPQIKAVGTPCLLIFGKDEAGSLKLETVANPPDETFVVSEVRRLAAGGEPR